jgi:hypothetical protein
MSSEVPPGLIESKERQQLARRLREAGPLTARGLGKDTGLPVACLRYHLRALATVGAVTPFLKGAAKGDEVAYALTPGKLPNWARETLLGEVSMQTCSEVAWILWSEGRQDVATLAVRLDLSKHEVARHLKALGMEGWAEGTPRFGVGIRPDRLSDHDPEWIDRWLERPREERDGADPREDGAE